MKQVIVITGLAQGMGREVAKLLANKGNIITGFDVDPDGIASLKKELENTGNDHLIECLDVTDQEGILNFRDSVLEKYKRVDTVLSNVGIGFFGPFEEVNLDKALKCLEINVIGTAAIFQAFIPHMRDKRKGKLISMSSLVGRIPFPFESIYTASKFAVEGLVQSIFYEVKPFGIKMGIIEPAQVSTSFAAKIHFLPEKGSPYRDRVKRFIDRDNELIKTAITPENAAQKIVNFVEKDNLKFHNQLEFSSTFFQYVNKLFPKSLRDSILVNYMNIKA